MKTLNFKDMTFVKDGSFYYMVDLTKLFKTIDERKLEVSIKLDYSKIKFKTISKLTFDLVETLVELKQDVLNLK